LKFVRILGLQTVQIAEMFHRETFNEVLTIIPNVEYLLLNAGIHKASYKLLEIIICVELIDEIQSQKRWGPYVIKLFTTVINKIECLSLSAPLILSNICGQGQESTNRVESQNGSNLGGKY